MLGTVNVLEYCRRRNAGLILLSTSRVYSVSALSALPLESRDNSFYLRTEGELHPESPTTESRKSFLLRLPCRSMASPSSPSERLAFEYGAAFRFPVWVNRCGVMSGAGQLGRAIRESCHFGSMAVSAATPRLHWLRRPRPSDSRLLASARSRSLAGEQMERGGTAGRRVCNVGGGIANSISLAQLNQWCRERFGPHAIRSENEGRAFDVPWLVLNAGSAAAEWDWRPQTKLDDILEEVATHAETHPEWLERTQG